jgi:hypothetical protein
VKVCFDNEDMRIFGLDRHICEVQLLLRPLIDPQVRALTTHFLEITPCCHSASDPAVLYWQHHDCTSSITIIP